MFFIGVFSSQVLTILVYLSIFLYFSVSITSHEVPIDFQCVDNTEKQICFEQKASIEYLTIFSCQKEKQNLHQNQSIFKSTDFNLCRFKNNLHKEILESELVYSFHAENTIFNRPPPSNV